MQDCSENSTLLGANPNTRNIEDIISCLLVLIACRPKQIILQWGKPSTSKCQASFVFDDDTHEKQNRR
jgi:hypothetical protein